VAFGGFVGVDVGINHGWIVMEVRSDPLECRFQHAPQIRRYFTG
jgi:hypothetical protein